MLAAAVLAERVLAGDSRAISAFNLDRAGLARHSQDFLEDAAIDVRRMDFADALFRRIERRLLQLEESF